MESFASDCEQPGNTGDTPKRDVDSGIVLSPGISLDVPGGKDEDGTPMTQQPITPAYQTPLRQHRRTASQQRQVKETLNARSEYTNNEEDGKAEHHINQYIVKDEIGRGSFGAVHLAVDQYGKEFAVKEFSKSRLRKRAQSNILRRPRGIRNPGHLAAGGGFNSPLHRHSASDIHGGEEQGNPLFLIKEEIAIMKKLNHPNLVSLIEVLDDPEEDSLYMVLEMCKKGVVMKVGLNEKADPYDIESCRCWFRDLILGIEYLHAQGVVHRDIKPDNLLLTEDDVLKIVDFGVSEMFEKRSEMMTAKSAGSPAFLPPELCVTNHGDIAGKAADIWSMGISLYCLRFGRIPFERPGVLDLYEAIRNDQVVIEPDNNPDFVDLMGRLLEKDPKMRITMAELRDHPWVTKNGTDQLLPAEENIADLVEPPSDMEVNHAITAKMRNLIVLMKAVKKFKSLLVKKRPAPLFGTLGNVLHHLHQPCAVDGQAEPALHKPRSIDILDRRNIEITSATDVIHNDISGPDSNRLGQTTNRIDSALTTVDAPGQSSHEQSTPHLMDHKLNCDAPLEPPDLHSESSGEKGHAHDPLDEAPLFLGIGIGDHEPLEVLSQKFVAESPTAAGFNIYDTAYQEEVERIRAAQGHRTKVYLTRRVESKKKYKADENMSDAPKASEVEGILHEGWRGSDFTGRKGGEPLGKDQTSGTSHVFSDIASKAMESTKTTGKVLGDKGGTAMENFMHIAKEWRTEMAENEEM